MSVAAPHRDVTPEDATVVLSLIGDLFDAAYNHGLDSDEYLGLLARCTHEFDQTQVLDALLSAIVPQYQSFPQPIIGDHPAVLLLRTIRNYVATHPITTPEVP